MLRRKPYSQLPGVELSVAAKAPPPPAPVVATALDASLPPLTPAAAAPYNLEIRYLATLIESFRASTDSEGTKMCSFASEKLAQATDALLQGDKEKSWFHLYGAAKLCVSFDIQPELAVRAMHRIDTLL